MYQYYLNSLQDILASDLNKNERDFLNIFLNTIKELENTEKEQLVLETKIKLLTEAFLRFLPNDMKSKIEIRQLKMKQWKQHHGFFTVNFYLAYEQVLGAIISYLNVTEIEKSVNKILNLLHIESKNVVIDKKNQVIVKKTEEISINVPKKEEVGVFTKTFNKTGGFTTAPCDPISENFIEYAKSKSGEKSTFLEIGAAFGSASLAALANGAELYCNDIEPQNLVAVKKRYMANYSNLEEDDAGDYKNLIFIPGSFHEDFSQCPKNFFDAILICRVLHFFPGEKIKEALKLMYELLKPGGKIFIVCETPYLKNWEKFIPTFEKRKDEGVEFPGEIDNPSIYESSGRAEALPSFVHWMTEDVLTQLLLLIGYQIEKVQYINRKGQFPSDLSFPEDNPNHGKESVGAIAFKPK